MAANLRKLAPLTVVVVLLVAAGWYLLRPGGPAPDPKYADLGSPPDWTRLDAYGGTISRSEFEDLLSGPFTLGDSWRRFVSTGEEGARLATADGWRDLPFAAPGAAKAPPRYWRPARDMPPAPADRPLDGVRIAIDPGHLGGDFAVVEERWFQVGEKTPVTEGDLTLKVAKLLKPRLAALGAEVSLVREEEGPVVAERGPDFRSYARAKLRDGTPAEIRRLSERLFYRTAEIRERARRVNEEIRPDLVLCLHFNAEAWGDPAAPELLDRNHFHIILNGAYTPGEVAHHDERFQLLLKLLQRTHEEERAVCTAVAGAMAAETSLPPYTYRSDASALPVGGDGYLWARNLLANRLYECPVVFLEPYVMNDTGVHERIQDGDYPGTRPVAGEERKSIFREYADGVTEGLRSYYAKSRPSR